MKLTQTANEDEVLLQEVGEADDTELLIKQKLEAEGISDAKVNINLKRPGRVDWQFMAEIPFEDWSLDYMKRTWGGGDYQCKFKANGRIFTSKRFPIDYNAKPEISQEETKPTADESALSKMVEKMSPPGAGNELVMQLMQQNATQSQSFLLLMQKAQSEQITAMTNLVAAMTAKPGAAAPEKFNMLEALAVFDKLKSPGSGVDPLELLRFAKDLLDEKKDTGGGWVDKLFECAPQLLTLMSGRGLPMPPGMNLPALPAGRTVAPSPPVSGALPSQAGELPSVIPPGAGTTPNGQPAPVVPISTTPEEMKALIVWMVRQKLPMLKAYAAQNVDPLNVATLLSNPLMVPEGQFTELCAMLEKETWLQDIFGGLESVAPNLAWFESLRVEILEEKKAMEENENDQARDGGPLGVN